MVNVRRQPGGGGGCQMIKLTGPTSILRKPIQAPARLAGTWYEFLKGLGIKLTPRDGICVKTAKSKIPARTADLSEKVSDFVRKYITRRYVHTVELMVKNVGGTSGGSGGAPQTNQPGASSGRQVIPASGGGSISGPSSSSSGAVQVEKAVAGPSSAVKVEAEAGPTPEVKVEPIAGPAPVPAVEVAPPVRRGRARAAKFIAPRILSVRSLVGNEATLPVENEEDADSSGDNAMSLGGEEEDDDGSLVTGVSTENRDLIRDGIQIEDIRSYVNQRMARFSPSMLLKTHKEYKKLRRKNPKGWDMNVKRAPLASYFIQELFK